MLPAPARVPLRDRDTSEEEIRAHLAPEFVGPQQRGCDRLLTRGRPDEHRQRLGWGLFAEPRAKTLLWVLADSAVHDGGHFQADEIASEVVGWVHRGEERKGAFLGIAVALVINVVEHEAVDAHGAQALKRLRGDLTGLLRLGRQARWRQREEQELTRPLGNAPLQLHAPKRS